MDNNNINILDMVSAAAQATEEKWLTTSPRIYVEGEGYVEAWWAKEVFTRLKMILFVVSNFSPAATPAGIMEYRKGLANIAKHGVPRPEELLTPDCHD